MSERRLYALVTMRWRNLAPPRKYPATKAFGTTGYREQDGLAGIFSVYVVPLAGRPGPAVEQTAKVYALVVPRHG